MNRAITIKLLAPLAAAAIAATAPAGAQDERGRTGIVQGSSSDGHVIEISGQRYSTAGTQFGPPRYADTEAVDPERLFDIGTRVRFIVREGTANPPKLQRLWHSEPE